MSRNNRIGLCLLIFTVLLTFTRPSVAQSNVVGSSPYWNSVTPAGNYTDVSASDSFAVGVRTDGSLVAWGTDWLGMGVLNCPSGTFTSVCANPGGTWAVGLRTDGTLAAWGNNSSGELNVPSGTFVSIAAGGNWGCALRPDGTAVTWGNGGTYDLGGTFTQISSFAGLRTDGTVVDFWDDGAPTGTFTSISCGVLFALGIRTDGSLATWGDDGLGPPTLPSGNGFVQVSAGGYGCWAAIQSDGTVVAGPTASSAYGQPFPGVCTSVSAGYNYVLGVQAVPEPSSLLALLCGVAGLGGIALRRRRHVTGA